MARCDVLVLLQVIAARRSNQGRGEVSRVTEDKLFLLNIEVNNAPANGAAAPHSQVAIGSNHIEEIVALALEQSQDEEE